MSFQRSCVLIFKWNFRLNECHICGKRVMSLTAHLKIHEKRAEKSAHLEVSAFTLTPSPGTKSKRAAAQK